MAPKRSKDTSDADGKSPLSSRCIAITAAEGYTGRLICTLLLDDENYIGKYKSIVAVTASGQDDELTQLGAKVVAAENIRDAIESEKIDTMFIIPPATSDKVEEVKEYLQAAKDAKTVVNMMLLSSAGCDYAERDKQPRLREFIDIEALVLAEKSNTSSESTGHSPFIIRAGFYSENLLLFNKAAQKKGMLTLPIDAHHKLAPVSLGDIAILAATALTSEGPHGLGDEFRGQLVTVTGPLLVAGPELAKAASTALGTELKFRSITQNQAKKALAAEAPTEVDKAEQEYLFEFYSLVREGKTAYVSTAAYQQLVGQEVTKPEEFFKLYKNEFKPTTSKRRKTE